MIVSCVLRQSVAFRPEHVYWLGHQIARMMPHAKFVPFSDVPLDIPHERLETKWPSWWAKMEAYSRLPEGRVLMLDLDTVIVSPWAGMPVSPETAYMPTFPGRKTQLFGCWQFSGSEFRYRVAQHFASDPERWVEESEGCDQKYYARHFLEYITPINHLVPDLCVSYKMQAKPHGIWPRTSFVLFHGLPRPWDCTEGWIPPLTGVSNGNHPPECSNAA